MRTLCLLAVLSACLSITQSTAQTLWIKGGANFIPAFPGVSRGSYIAIAKDVWTRGFMFQPGLQYTYHNYSIRNIYGSEDRYSVHVVQMPLNFRFDIGRWAGFALAPQLGVIPYATGRYRQDPSRPVTSSFFAVNLSGAFGPYFRINERLVVELRGIIDAQEFDNMKWDLKYITIQPGVSWSVTKPSEE